jgi:hypothetical protein
MGINELDARQIQHNILTALVEREITGPASRPAGLSFFLTWSFTRKAEELRTGYFRAMWEI